MQSLLSDIHRSLPLTCPRHGVLHNGCVTCAYEAFASTWFLSTIRYQGLGMMRWLVWLAKNAINEIEAHIEEIMMK